MSGEKKNAKGENKTAQQAELFERPNDFDTCKTCENRQRHLCGARVFQYCGVRGSNRTVNRLLKIKINRPACQLYVKRESSKMKPIASTRWAWPKKKR